MGVAATLPELSECTILLSVETRMRGIYTLLTRWPFIFKDFHCDYKSILQYLNYTH